MGSEGVKTKKYQKSYFDVLGICCTSEIPIIENILKSLDGVKEYSVIVPSRTVIVVHDSLLISPLQIAKALNQARLEANVRVNGETNFKNKWPNPFAVVSGLLLLFSALKFFYPPLRWLAVVAVAAGIYPILAKAVSSIKRLRVDINILVIITVIATLAMQDYTEAAAVVFLFTIADWLETRASYKANSVMQSLMSLAPQKAIIAETGEEVEVDEVKVNTVLAVKAGETIPIDGIVVDGNCEVDEKTLTGEAFPVHKLKDSTVWAGTINLNGYISVKTTALASDCVVTKMAKLVEDAQSSKTKSQRLIDKWSQYYTPAIIVVSACIAIIPVIMKVHNPNHWFHLALVVLVSACPCGLILSTPVATFCALTKAATSGLLIKSADYLDTLSKIKITAFDKTGTITRGEFIVIEFKSLSKDINLRSLLYWVSSVESKSSHPMAATIVDYAKSVNVEPRPEEVEDYQNFPGEGIYGKIDGNNIYIGNKRIASRVGCSTAPEIEVDTKGGKTVGYIYVGERLAGVFNLSDACRSGVAQAMTELKSLGIKTAMLTGDNQASAMYAQEQLGNALDVVHGDLLPEDKSRIIQEFKKEGPTAMVGDGVNDAPALATADIGISMGISGSALATQSGHIILMSNDIRRIPQAIRLARRARRKVVENLFLSITLKVGILALAFAGHPLIWAAVLVDVGTCLLVILNSMLLLREKDKTKNKKCYRKKVEGTDGDILDLEAGLLTKNQCNSGCCGDKKNQEIVMMKTSSKTSSEYCQSDCCGDKHQENVKLLLARDSCCGEKTKKPEGDMASSSSCKKPTHVHNHLKMKGGSGCCASKNEERKEIVAKRCCEKPKQQMKSTGECRSSHCEEKKQTEEMVPIQIIGQDLAVLEKGMQTKDAETCKSRCRGNKEKAKETRLLLCKEMGVPIKDEGSSKSGCCGDGEQIVEATVVDCKEKQSCHEKIGLDIEMGVCSDTKLICCGNTEGKAGEKSNMEIKNEDHCKTSCCGDGEQILEATVVDYNSGCCGNKETQSCHEKTGLDIEIGVCCDTKLVYFGNTEGKVEEKSNLEIKNEDHCKSGCSGDKEEIVEATVVDYNSGCCENKEKQSCHENTGLDICCDTKLVCCGNTERKVGEKSDLEIKSEGHCKSSGCSDEKQTGEITLALEEEIDRPDCSSECCVDKENATQICNEKTICKPLCCGETKAEVRAKSDQEIKNEGHCKSDCCSDEKQTGEITLASEEDTESSDCSSGCCEDKEEVTRICHEKPVRLVVSGLEIESGGDCKTICCGTGLKKEESSNEASVQCLQSKSSCCSNKQEIVEVSSQSCCSNKKEIVEVSSQSCCSNKQEIVEVSNQSYCPNPTALVLSDLQVKKDENSELSCCGTSEKAVKVETSCCKVKTPVACASKCSVREKRHIGKSCCRSYAKEFCSHRHHHHHHHHHHHVGAA